MKKSEMAIIIRKAIIDHNKSIGDFEGYGVGAAEFILDKILEAGMIPPEADDFNIGNCWEPEESDD